VAIKPAINPGIVTGKKTPTMNGAINFVSGGTPLGTSVVASAANKIVGFQRGAAAVAPRVPDLGSIIQTLSSNILTNVENKFASANQVIQQVIQNNFLQQLGEYRNKIQEVVSNPPSKILQNFLNLYREALSYIQFLTDRRNIKRLGKNLKALQRVFSESFQIAALVRETIVKIVKQLSNLPRASTGAGGLNLDIKVPGGPLKRSLPGGRGKMLKMLGIGAGLVGAGALGSQVVSGMMDVGDQEVTPTQSPDSIPTPLLDRFSQILDRFDKVLQSFARPSSKGSSSGGFSGSIPTPTDDETPAGPDGTVPSGTSGENLAAFTSILEGTSGQNAADAMQVMLNRAATDHSGYGDLFGQVTAKEQFSPISSAIYADSLDPDAKKVYGPIADKLGKTPQERIQKLKEIASGPNGLQNLEQLFGRKGSAAEAAKILTDFKTGGTLSTAAREGVKGRRFFKGQTQLKNMVKGVDFYRGTGGNFFHGNAGGKVGMLEQLQPTGEETKQSVVSPAKTDQEVKQQVAADVSRPASPVSQQPEITILPMDMGTMRANRGPSGMAPPDLQGGTKVPFLSSTNDDNFFTMLSKVVYNIVDG